MFDKLRGVVAMIPRTWEDFGRLTDKLRQDIVLRQLLWVAVLIDAAILPYIISTYVCNNPLLVFVTFGLVACNAAYYLGYLGGKIDMLKSKDDITSD